jgi:hydrogenase nickel incorporation protein HypA/HybF
MHELSIVLQVIDMAEKEATKYNAASIAAIELEIGELSGIEMSAFDFAWQQAVRSTMLQHAVKKVHRITGQGWCVECKALFPLHQLYECCPTCGAYSMDIRQGKELRVKCLEINEKSNLK